MPYSVLQRSLGATRVYRELVNRFLDLEPGMSVLDVGAGTAILRDALGDVAYTALEPNSRYCRQMRERFAGGTERVIEGTSSAMETIEGSFDRIIMFALLHHLSDATATEAFQHAARLLAPGGKVVALDNGFHPDQGLISRYLAKIDRGANVRNYDGYGALARPYFKSVDVTVTTHLLRVPYSHVWTVCEHPY